MKAYKFFSGPNRIVNDGNTGLRLLQFDEQGEYITLDKILANRMAIHFKCEEIELIEKSKEVEKTEKPKDNNKILKCKKCNYETENNGELLAHYRKSHPKEG